MAASPLNRDTFNFTPDFEDLIIATYLNDPASFLQYGQLLKPEYFTTAVSALTTSCIFKHQEKYSRVPSWEALTQILLDEVSRLGSEPADISAYVVRLSQMPPSDSDFVISRVIDFCKERATLQAAKHVVRCLKEGKLPEAGFVKPFEEALAIGQNLDDLGVLLNSDFGRIIDQTSIVGRGTRTGIPQWDAIWRQGWEPGWLAVLLAPPKRYKSITAINVATSVASHAVGGDVIYYACEISERLASLRAMYQINGLSEDELIANPESFKLISGDKIEERLSGRILFKHFPIGTATIAQLEAHASIAIKQLGLNPKLIVIDYADTIRPSDPSQPRDVQQSSIYKEAIAFGSRKKCPILMPDRCNAEAVSKRVPNLTSFQGAYAKGGIVDIAIALCSTDEEYAQNVMRQFVLINRHGPAYQHFLCDVDAKRALVTIRQEIPYEPEVEETEERRAGFRQGGGNGNRRSSNRGTGMPPELVDD